MATSWVRWYIVQSQTCLILDQGRQSSPTIVYVPGRVVTEIRRRLEPMRLVATKLFLKCVRSKLAIVIVYWLVKELPVASISLVKGVLVMF